MTAPDTTSALRAAVIEGRYEAAALRLAIGLLVTLHDTAPEAREELIASLSLERRRDG